MSRPLAGVKVVEVANWIAVPGAGALMADLGAEVIKVEPPRGDAMRNLIRKPAVEDARKDLDTSFQLENRGKRSIAIDLEAAEGRALVHRLLREADVLTTNLLPERMARYELDPDRVHAIAPRIVHVSLSAFGHEGAEADRTGFDLMAFFARSGVTDILTDPDGAPPTWRPGQGDHSTALNLLAATLAALRLRDQTGRGQVVRTSLLQTGTYTLGCDFATALIDRKRPPRTPLAERPNALYRPWLCKDGRWVLLMMLNARLYWPGFCRAIDRPDWIEDPRFVNHEARVKNRAELFATIEEIIAQRPLAEWGDRFDRHELMWAPILRMEDVVDDPQLRANGAFVPIEHPVYGRFETLAAPFAIRDADVAVRGCAPEIGEHTEEILRGTGLQPDAIAALREAGIVGPKG